MFTISCDNKNTTFERVDPICGMKAVVSVIIYSLKGEMYYFYTENCKEKFVKNTEEYVGNKKAGSTKKKCNL